MSKRICVLGGILASLTLGVGAVMAGCFVPTLNITFANVAAVPTLGELGVFALFLALGVSGFTFLNKRGVAKGVALGIAGAIAFGGLFAARPVLAIQAGTPMTLNTSPTSANITQSPQTFNVTNGTTSSITITNIAVNQTNKTNYTQTGGNCAQSTVLTTVGNCTVTVTNNIILK